jgi:hypothetical protein
MECGPLRLPLCRQQDRAIAALNPSTLSDCSDRGRDLLGRHNWLPRLDTSRDQTMRAPKRLLRHPRRISSAEFSWIRQSVKIAAGRPFRSAGAGCVNHPPIRIIHARAQWRPALVLRRCRNWSKPRSWPVSKPAGTCGSVAGICHETLQGISGPLRRRVRIDPGCVDADPDLRCLEDLVSC